MDFKRENSKQEVTQAGKPNLQVDFYGGANMLATEI